MCLVHIASLCICFSRSPALNILHNKAKATCFLLLFKVLMSWTSVFHAWKHLYFTRVHLTLKETKCSRFSKFRDCCEMYFLNIARRSSLDIQMFRGLWMFVKQSVVLWSQFHTAHVPLLCCPASVCFFQSETSSISPC